MGVGWLRDAIRRVLGSGRTPESSAQIERVIVGLGNPGPEHVGQRHNVGFRVVEAFAQRHGIAFDREIVGGRMGVGELEGRKVALLEPQTYMNRSGDCVSAALPEWPKLDVGQHLIVVFDDLDLPLGRLRVRAGGGAGGHRGMSSIIACLGHANVPRLRFGIGRPAANASVVDHVLADFDDSEVTALEERVEAAVDALQCFALRGLSAAMDRANAPASQGDCA